MKGALQVVIATAGALSLLFVAIARTAPVLLARVGAPTDLATVALVLAAGVALLGAAFLMRG